MSIDLNDSMAALAREEAAFKRGFDAGVAHQKKAGPSPRAKQYRDALKTVLLALKDLDADVSGKFGTNACVDALIAARAAITIAEGLLR